MRRDKKKAKRERRVLIAAMLVAAITIAGSTFAWFSSSDEVTNRLSASANYGVTIAEDFTPPANWIPGQEVDKNVAVVNTGNVDAFVRTWLEGEMRILNEKAGVLTWDTSNSNTGFKNATATLVAKAVLKTDLSAVTDTALKDLNLNYKVTSGGTDYYLKELSKVTATNPNPATQSTATNPNAFSEVMSVQAGGELVYTSGTVFTYTPNQSITVQDADKAIQNIVAGQSYTVTIGTNAKNITVDNTNHTISVSELKYLPSIDSDTFKPATTGLYIFRRNVEMKDTFNSSTAADQDDMEFSGYFYVATANTETGTGVGSGVYLALHNGVAASDTDRSDYTLPKDAINATYADSTNTWTYAPTADLSLFTAERKTLQNNELKWTYDSTSNNKLTVTYDNGTGSTTDDLVIDIALVNVVTNGTADKWAPVGSTLTSDQTGWASGSDKYTFYYTNDLEEGCTTSRLVESVTMNNSVNQTAYMAFDFDLNVFMDSVQVTVSNTGAESNDSVNPWAAAPSTNGIDSNVGRANAASATLTMDATDANEIASISWAS